MASSSRQYTKSGIGGHGNYHKSSGVVSIPIAPQITVTQSAGVFTTGIGGAGNICRGKPAAITPEELISRRIMQEESAARSCYHGIGGAGNRSIYSESMSSSLSSSASSNASTRRSSGADRLKEKTLQVFQRPSFDSISLLSSAGVCEKA